MKTQSFTLLAWCTASSLAVPFYGLGKPMPRDTTPTVTVLSANVHGPNVTALQSIPTSVTAELRAFLDKYQALANNASAQIGAKTQDTFTSAGHCFAEYPCFSVERGAMATLGSEPEISLAQVSAVLDHLLSSPSATFDNSRPGSTLSGLTLTVNNVTLEVVAPRGTMASTFLAGMVFDMYKMQQDSTSTNAIRAVQAKTDNQARPFFALCLYPKGTDSNQAYNFCIGSELDGDAPTAPSRRQVTKRLSVEGTLAGLCAMIPIPILCHKVDA